MTRYVGCIDIHNGQVKQIVGSTLTTTDSDLSTNFVASNPPSYYSTLYKDNNVTGTHVIKLGSNKENDLAAEEAIKAWKNMLQVGGGINDTNAQHWIDLGASKVIVTSWLFPDGKSLDWGRLQTISSLVGREKLVVDVSCKRQGAGWVVAINKWQTLTDCVLNQELFDKLSNYCTEILVHAADVEGLCKGIDEQLVKSLGEWCQHLSNMKVVYAGGAKSIDDLDLVNDLSKGKVDLTYGSSVDIFGGSIKFTDLVKWNQSNN